MAVLLNQCFDHLPSDLATKEELSQLKDKLAKGHQTDGRDHVILANALKVSVVIHHTDQVRENLLVEGSEEPSMHVRLRKCADGEGNVEGHFDLLIPRRLSHEPPKAQVGSANNPKSVSHGVTLRGPELAASILHGYKDLENRNCSLQGRWIAIHLAKSESFPALKKQVKHLVPDLNTEGMIKGHILGLIFVSESLTIAEYRQRVQCGDACTFPAQVAQDLQLPVHVENCKCSPWAIGPVVNVIQHRIIFSTPLPDKGQVNKWPLSHKTLEAIKAMIDKNEFTFHTNKLADGPLCWPLPWLAEGTGRVKEVEACFKHCSIFFGPCSSNGFARLDTCMNICV